MTLFEALECVASDKYADSKSPGELAVLLKPWLGNLTDRTPCADSAPLMLRMTADALGWNRFNYEGWPTYQQLAAAHYILRAAESLTDVQDLESSLFLIGLSRKICKEIATRLSNSPASQRNSKS